MSICGVTKVEWPCVATDGCHVALASESGDEPLKYVPSQREIPCGLRLKKARYRHSAGSWRGTSLASARTMIAGIGHFDARGGHNIHETKAEDCT